MKLGFILFCLFGLFLNLPSKRYCIIDQQIVRNYVHSSECLSTPLPFYAAQIIDTFLNSSILANHDKGLRF